MNKIVRVKSDESLTLSNKGQNLLVYCSYIFIEDNKNNNFRVRTIIYKIKY